MPVFWACLVIAICIVTAAFFSGSETAFVVADRIRLRHLAAKGDRRAMIVENLRASPEKFLGATLVGTNLAIVGGSVVATQLIAHILGQSSNLAALLETLIMTPLVLVLAEIVPKNYFRIHADSLVLRLAPWVRLSYRFLAPLVFVTTGFSRLLSRQSGTKGRKIPFVTREELRYLARESHRSGLIEKQEHYIIGQIFDFAETTVQEVMVPLSKVVVAEINQPIAQVVEIIKREGKSRIPVYEKELSHVVGVVDINHLLTARRNTPLRQLLYPLSTVRGGISIEQLFLQLQRNHEHMALVSDGRGEVIGIVTMEDLLEEIVGEIKDEHDER